MVRALAQGEAVMVIAYPDLRELTNKLLQANGGCLDYTAAGQLILSASYSPTLAGLTVTGNTALGDAATDVVTITGLLQFAAGNVTPAGNGLGILAANVLGVYITSEVQRWSSGASKITGTLNVTGAVTLDSTLTVTGVAQFNNGTTVTTPGITFTGDLNTGLGWVSADIFRFIAGGSERGRVDGTGTVTTPLWRLSGDGAVNWIFWLTALPNPSFPKLFITQHATP